MKTNFLKVDILKDAIRDFTESEHIEVYLVDTASVLELGINWEACGTVSPEETLKFASDLSRVAGIVAAINTLGFEIEWFEENSIRSSQDRAAAIQKLHQFMDSIWEDSISGAEDFKSFRIRVADWLVG